MTLKSESLLKLGTWGLCLKRWMGVSNISSIAGRTTTTLATPSTTPFDMTIPISRPSVKLMKQRARKPKTVVSELPASEMKVFDIALDIASFFPFLSDLSTFLSSSSYLSMRNTE